MKLLTEAIKKQLPKLYATENIPLMEKEIVCKLFNPMGVGTWYVIEGQEEEDGEFLIYGIASIHDKEFGYFSLKELESVRLPLGLKIERDVHFERTTVAQIWDEA